MIDLIEEYKGYPIKKNKTGIYITHKARVIRVDSLEEARRIIDIIVENFFQKSN